MATLTNNSAHVQPTQVFFKKRIPLSHKNLQAQTRKWKYKAHLVSSHLQVKHDSLCNPCLCLILEVPRWIWQWIDSLYHRFLKWKLKCENILDCELAMLPESKKCKKVIALNWRFWNGSICFLVLVLQKILAWIQFGPSMKIFASHKLMKLGPDLTCLQPSDKAIIL